MHDSKDWKKTFCYFHDKKIQKQRTLCEFLCDYLKKCKKEIGTKKEWNRNRGEFNCADCHLSPTPLVKLGTEDSKSEGGWLGGGLLS